MLEALYCRQCDQEFYRTRTRGRKPHLCLDCRATPRLVITASHPTEKNDCTVRALSQATNTPYPEVHEFMRRLGRKDNCGVPFKSVMKKYPIIFDHKAIPRYLKRSRGLRTLFIRNPELKKGTWIIHSTHHVAVLKEGQLIDSWDSSRKVFDFAWKIERIPF